MNFQYEGNEPSGDKSQHFTLKNVVYNKLFIAKTLDSIYPNGRMDG